MLYNSNPSCLVPEHQLLLSQPCLTMILLITEITVLLGIHISLWNLLGNQQWNYLTTSDLFSYCAHDTAVLHKESFAGIILEDAQSACNQFIRCSWNVLTWNPHSTNSCENTKNAKWSLPCSSFHVYWRQLTPDTIQRVLLHDADRRGLQKAHGKGEFNKYLGGKVWNTCIVFFHNVSFHNMCFNIQLFFKIQAHFS